MSPGSPKDQREWPTAVWKLFHDYLFSPPSGGITCVDFRFGPPRRGRLPFRINTDGRWTLLCELCDAFPSFPLSLRGWMERSLVLDREGYFHPEVVTLDCVRGVLRMGWFHAHWEMRGAHAAPVSCLIVFRPGEGRPAVFCFCDTLETIGRLYGALQECFSRYRRQFNDPELWYDVKRFDYLNPAPAAERLLGQTRSPQIEKMCKAHRKK